MTNLLAFERRDGQTRRLDCEAAEDPAPAEARRRPWSPADLRAGSTGARRLRVEPPCAPLIKHAHVDAGRRPIAVFNAGRHGGVLNVYSADAAGDLSPVAAKRSGACLRAEQHEQHRRRDQPADIEGRRALPRRRPCQHVVPSWDQRTLYATTTLELAHADRPATGDSARTSRLTTLTTCTSRRTVTPRSLSPSTDSDSTFGTLTRSRFQDSLTLDCAGVDHLDFSADDHYLFASCEFSGRLVKVDLATKRVVGYLDLPGSSPQDVKLEPAGKVFYVADLKLGGVHLTMEPPFGQSASSRPAATRTASTRAATQVLYVSNRRGASISVIDFATARSSQRGRFPGTSPDMGGVSADGVTPLARRPVQRSRVCNLHRRRTPDRRHPRTEPPTRSLRVATARSLLTRAHRHPPLDVHRPGFNAGPADV